MDPDLESKLRDIAERDAIHQVMLRYCRGLDRLDRALVRSCYWDDAIEDHGSYVGQPDDFIDWADSTTEAFRYTQHGIMNHFCELDGNDAYAETYYQFTGISFAPPHFVSTGRYVDHFQKRNGEWKIANRVCIIEGKYEVADASINAVTPDAYTPEEPCQEARDRSDVSYHRPPVPRRPKQLA